MLAPSATTVTAAVSTNKTVLVQPPLLAPGEATCDPKCSTSSPSMAK